MNVIYPKDEVLANDGCFLYLVLWILCVGVNIGVNMMIAMAFILWAYGLKPFGW